jgi:protein-disulfide isomerase
MKHPFLVSLVLLAGCEGSAPLPPPASAPVAHGAAGAAPGATTAGADDAPVPITARNPTWGSRTAPVTIVEFADFQCPYCRVGEATMAHVRATYGPSSVRIVWKNSPLDFHAEAHPTAEAAAAVFALAGGGAFWKFHSAAFMEQSDLGVENSVKWAKAAGVTDVDALRTGLMSHRWAPAVDADLAEGQSLGVRGTPTFFVNGIGVVGAQPFETFRALIDDQIRAAQAKLATGTPPERLYTELSRDNRAGAPKVEAQDDGDDGDTKTVFKVPVGHSPVRGSSGALVTLVEFADYQCPYCARVEETVKALRDEYGDKLRVVFKDEPLPFHDRAEPAAEAALQVREEKGDPAFWQMHDALFASQDDLKDDTLVRIAAQLGARPDRVKTAIEKHTHSRSIEDDLELSDDLQADGTPHFFIDGRRLVGSQPKEKFEAIIDEELKKAQDLVSKGTKPGDDLYEALTRDGRGPPPPETRDLAASLPTRDPMRGGPQAKVVVHEWSDFQCPFCSRVEPTVARLLKEYAPRIKLVWHDLPLPMHPDAPLAAQAAREALAQRGDKGFWALHDTLFDHQKDLGRDALDGYAHALGLDAGKWRSSLDGGQHRAEIEADSKAAADMDIHGTPSFVIAVAGAKTGYFLSGAQPYPRFRKLVERALGEAK